MVDKYIMHFKEEYRIPLWLINFNETLEIALFRYRVMENTPVNISSPYIQLKALVLAV